MREHHSVYMLALPLAFCCWTKDSTMQCLRLQSMAAKLQLGACMLLTATVYATAK